MAILSERRLNLTQAAHKLGVNPSTAWRFALHGVRGVQLETFSVGVKRFTTEESITRFIEACTTAAAGEQPTPQARTPRQREQDIQRTERELDRVGI